MSEEAWALVSNERALERRGAGGIVDDLVEQLAQGLALGTSIGTFVNMPHFALEHGYYWKLDPSVLPNGLGPQPLGECHISAQKLACNAEGISYLQGALYVEGYVSNPVIPILHGWNLLADGSAVDVTFASNAPGGIREYFGVPFTTRYVLETILKAEANLSLIDNWEASWPLLSATAEELEGIICRPPGWS